MSQILLPAAAPRLRINHIIESHFFVSSHCTALAGEMDVHACGDIPNDNFTSCPSPGIMMLVLAANSTSGPSLNRHDHDHIDIKPVTTPALPTTKSCFRQSLTTKRDDILQSEGAHSTGLPRSCTRPRRTCSCCQPEQWRPASFGRRRVSELTATELEFVRARNRVLAHRNRAKVRAAREALRSRLQALGTTNTALRREAQQQRAHLAALQAQLRLRPDLLARAWHSHSNRPAAHALTLACVAP